MRRITAFFFIVTTILPAALGQEHKPPHQPVATFNLSTSSSFDNSNGWASIVFASDATIAVGACLPEYMSQRCSLILLEWDGATLHQLAQTSKFDYGISLHPAGGGRFLGLRGISPVIVYSPDLSASRELPKEMPWLLSPSGELAAQGSNGRWKLYRLTEELEFLREVPGHLLFLSENVLVIQDPKVMRIETLDGKRLGSFSTPSEGYYSAAILGDSKLWLDDAKRIRITDFSGKTFLKPRPGIGCAREDMNPSSDGGRVLVNCNSHKASGLKHVIENIQTVTSLGMAGPGDVDHEEIRVFDTKTGKTCFEWQGRFPPTYGHVRSAAISPSGEFVAIVSHQKLSIYRIPANCDSQSSAAPMK